MCCKKLGKEIVIEFPSATKVYHNSHTLQFDESKKHAIVLSSNYKPQNYYGASKDDPAAIYSIDLDKNHCHKVESENEAEISQIVQ